MNDDAGVWIGGILAWVFIICLCSIGPDSKPAAVLGNPHLSDDVKLRLVNALRAEQRAKRAELARTGDRLDAPHPSQTLTDAEFLLHLHSIPSAAFEEQARMPVLRDQSLIWPR